MPVGHSQPFIVSHPGASIKTAALQLRLVTISFNHMEITVDTSTAVPVVRLSGDMRLWGKQGLSERVRETVYSLMSQGNQKVILNMVGVTKIDSRGIGCLARCQATAITQKSEIYLVLGKGIVHEALTQMSFVRVCPTFPSDEEAFAAAQAA